MVEDSFAHAEMAVVLSGDPIPRTLAARDLYREGRVGRILLIPEPLNPYREEMMKLGLIELSDSRSWGERILTASGIPPEKILVAKESADGTIQEALLVRRTLAGRFPKNLAVVTSKFAGRRARFIFRTVLRRDGIQILSHPSPYDPFQPDRWWAHPRNALTVLTEYEKLLVNALTLLLTSLQHT